MKPYILLLCLLGCSQMAIAQVITVTDQETAEPVIMATLSSESPKVFTTTNADGQADITAFKDSEAIEIRVLGYSPITKSFADLKQVGFSLQLKPSSFSLNQVVISATRWRQSSDNVPMRITSISDKEVALQNPQTAADLLGASGEVFIQKSQQGGGSPMIRGFSTNRLLYTVDGVRMNTAIFRSGNLQNVISLDPFAIEETEISFGPGSVIYGSDAIGGVMSFQTLTPTFAVSDETLTSGKAVARYSSANSEFTGHFDVNLGWKKWAMVSSISTNNYGDLRMGQYGPDSYLREVYVRRQDSMDVAVTNEDPRVQTPSGYSQINMMQKLRFRPSEKWDFQYGFHYSETSDYSRYDRQLRTRNGLPRYGEWAYGPQIWMMNNLSIEHTSSNALFDQATFRFAQQYFEESRISRNFNDEIREVRTEKVDAYSVNLDFSRRLGKGSRLYYGLEWVSNDVTSIGVNEDIETGKSEEGPARYPQATWSSYAAYLTAQVKLTDQLNLQAGTRYNQYQLDATFDTRFYPFPFETANINHGALTGSAGLVYRPASDWVINLNLANGFRAPNVDDAGKVFDSEPGAVVVPNPNLKPEQAYNIDFGIAKIFGEFLEVDLTAYYTQLENALVRRNYTLNGQDSLLYDGVLSRVQAVQNAAKANVYGLQAEIEIRLPANFRFSSHFNYQIGEEELDDGTTSPSRHAAPWFGLSRLEYARGPLQLQFNVQYSGAVPFEDMPISEVEKTEIYASDENGNPYAPSWYTLNFKAQYQLSEHFAINAGLENITDQRYRPYSSGIVAPGRNFLLALRAKF